MAANTFGEVYRVTTYGESHGVGIGVVIDGCPAGIDLDIELIKKDLQRRKPGQSVITTQRREEEEFEVLAGVFEGKTTGTPLSIFIRNTDQKSKDYSHIADQYRPSHADYTYAQKYGNRDYRGGGRSSARETAARVIAGSVANMILNQMGVHIHAFVSQVGHIKMENLKTIDYPAIETNIIRCPDAQVAEEMINYIKVIKKEGDTVGGVITCHINHCPVGIGAPVFDKLHADLGKAMLSINAVKGFEYGSGFASAGMRGSEHNDEMKMVDGQMQTTTNYAGGILGGISNGMQINFNVAFKPVATIMRDQASINTKGEEISLQGKGRHDPCVVPRAVPIVEAMAACVILDHVLRDRTVRLD